MQHIDTKIEGLRAGGGATLLGLSTVTQEEILFFITIVYFILQIVILCPKAVKAIRELRGKDASHH